MAVEYTGLVGKGDAKATAKHYAKKAQLKVAKKIDRDPYAKRTAKNRAKRAQGKDPVFGRAKPVKSTKNPVGKNLFW